MMPPNLRLIFFGVLFPLAGWSQSYTFTTIAGQASQVGSVDGSGSQARFFFPQGTAVDRGGNVYVADAKNQLVRKITPVGVVTTLAGTPGEKGTVDGPAKSARFSDPHDITVDGFGNVFVIGDDQAIRKITPTGAVSTLAGTPGKIGNADGAGSGATFNKPLGLVADSSGNLFVADSWNFTIRKISPGGVVTTYAGISNRQGTVDGPRGTATFAYPSAIAIDPLGNLYVSSWSSGPSFSEVIRKITPAGVVSTLPGSDCGPQAAIRGIAIDSAGNLLISASNYCVRRLTPTGVNTVLAGAEWLRGNQDGIGTNARFRDPWGICIDNAGYLYLAGGSAPVIRKIDLTGAVTTFVGQPSVAGSADGKGLAARFHAPGAITGDSNGNLFVADTQNCTIRRISPAGDVTTWVGSPSSPGDVRAAPSSPTRETWKPPTLAIDFPGNLFGVSYPSSKICAISPTKVATTIGTSGTAGMVDGPAGIAKFSRALSGVALDAFGNLFVADQDAIRRIARDGYVTTIAGSPNTSGSANGFGAAARFQFPSGLVVDRDGNTFVSDTGNNTIRKITPDGLVSTLAGSPGQVGNVDGTGAQARFSAPEGIALDAAGNLFVADSSNGSIRKISPAGVVSTLTGFHWDDYFFSEGVGARARFMAPFGIWVSPQGELYVTDLEANVVVKGVPDRIPVIATPPQSANVMVGAPALLSVTSAGGNLSYQWRFNGVPIPGATQATYTVAAVVPSTAGNYSVDVSNTAGTVTSASAVLAMTTPGRLTNLSVLTALAASNDSFTVGMALGGSNTGGPKPVLLRAMGPSLASVGVPNPVQSTVLTVYDGMLKTIENNGWKGDLGIATASTSVGAFAFASPASADSAVYVVDATGPGRTFTVSGTGTGMVLAEVYDATPPAAYTLATPRLVNLSVLKTLAGGLTAGFVVGGNTPMKSLIRAIGPSLSGHGVAGAVSRPKLELFDASGNSIATNAGWGGAPAVSAASNLAGAFPLDPVSTDAVILLELPPGNYTVKTTAADGLTGLALVEIYEVP